MLTSSANAADPAVTAVCLGELTAVKAGKEYRLKGEGTVTNLPNNSSVTVIVDFFRKVPNGPDVPLGQKQVTIPSVSGNWNYSTSWLEVTGADIPAVAGTEYYTKVEALYNSGGTGGIVKATSTAVKLLQ